MRGTIIAGLLLLATAAPALAETTRYQYDALGRVTSVDDRTNGTVGHAAALSYDRAGNRSNAQVEVAKYSALFPAVSQLNRGEEILTNNSLYRLTLQFDGNLVLYDQAGGRLWETGTTSGSFLVMQADGNLVLYDRDTRAVWNTQTNGHSGSFFAVQSDGNIVVYDANNHPLWARFGL